MTSEASIPSYEQLVDDLGEFGRMTSKAVIPSHEQLVDDLGEFGIGRRFNASRVTAASVIHQQLMNDLGEWITLSQPKAIASFADYDQLVDDLGEFGFANTDA